MCTVNVRVPYFELRKKLSSSCFVSNEITGLQSAPGTPIPSFEAFSKSLRGFVYLRFVFKSLRFSDLALHAFLTPSSSNMELISTRDLIG